MFKRGNWLEYLEKVYSLIDNIISSSWIDRGGSSWIDRKCLIDKVWFDKGCFVKVWFDKGWIDKGWFDKGWFDKGGSFLFFLIFT